MIESQERSKSTDRHDSYKSNALANITLSLSLRRRFEQNQEDCTFTTLALIPALSAHILDDLPVEKITHELQQKKAERLAVKGTASPEVASSELSSGPPSVVEDDGRSLQSFQSESYVHASQPTADGGSAAASEESSANAQPSAKKTKAQLWAELKIACTLSLLFYSAKNLSHTNSILVCKQ